MWVGTSIPGPKISRFEPTSALMPSLLSAAQWPAKPSPLV